VRWNQSLTDLDAIPGLDSKVWAKLMEHHIRSAEELVGQAEAEPEALAGALSLTRPELDDLTKRAYEVLSPATAAAIADQREREYGLGALPPDDTPER
jgi:tryptophan 2,3-dioxygenase